MVGNGGLDNVRMGKEQLKGGGTAVAWTGLEKGKERGRRREDGKGRSGRGGEW